MPKYKDYFQKMLSEHQKLFEDFKTIHHQYLSNRQKYQDKFNARGKKIVDIIKEYEDKLCAHSEKGVYGKYSANLAEKFQAEVKKLFPMIDFVGVEITSSKKPKSPNPFSSLKKLL